jgi:SSS family solute:Na+ symporter
MMGGFRSSVWTDVFQAVIMFVILFFIVFYTYNLYPDKSLIFDTLTQNDKGFLNLFNGYTLMSGLGFIVGWACASMGFSISQPQIIDRFYAAENIKEASKAKWLYIGFVQITWVGMTLVGVLLSGLVIGLDFPTSEKALSTIIAKDLHPIIKGLTLTAIFAAIASTADSLLISVSNSISNDLLKPILRTKDISHTGNRIILLLTAALTVGLAVFFVNGSVFDLVMSSIMLLGSSIAPAMIIKLMQWKNSPLSLFFCILTGLATALLWKYQFALSGHLNETVPAIIVSLTTNWITFKLTRTDEK